MKELNVVGIDLAKEIFYVHGVNMKGKQLFSKSIRRGKLAEFIAKLPRCIVAMEACGGSHYWARKFLKLEHDVKLISPQFVKPYVKSNKNDQLDAEAITEASVRPSMRFVPIKQVCHQDIQMLHRIRERLVKQRTALSNEIRGLLLEYGIAIPKGISHVRSKLPLILSDGDNELSDMGRELICDLGKELRILQETIAKYERRIKEIYKQNEKCQRIGEVEGVGPITATALLYAMSNPHLFKNGREFAAWLGLVPRQRSSGGKTVLLGISKRGDKYIRRLLVHGARAVVRVVGEKNDKRSKWIKEKKRTRGYNRASVALANKNARIVWALMATGRRYKKAA